VGEAQAPDIRARHRFDSARELQRIGEVADRCRTKALHHPPHIRAIGNTPEVGHDRRPRWWREAWQEPAVAFGPDQHFHHLAPLGCVYRFQGDLIASLRAFVIKPKTP
jgi:hypothetical protein